MAERLPLSRTGLNRAAERFREVIKGGWVALVPTETFYGLAADPTNPDAVDRVFRLKDRPRSMPLLVLCSDWQQVERLVHVPEKYRVRLSRSWPGPLTAVMRAKVDLPASAGTGTLAVRIPGHDLLRCLLYLTGPVTGTSANRHGDPPPRTVEEALSSLSGTPDLLLDGGVCPGGMPSTLVDLSGPEPRLLRPGPVAFLP